MVDSVDSRVEYYPGILRDKYGIGLPETGVEIRRSPLAETGKSKIDLVKVDVPGKEEPMAFVEKNLCEDRLQFPHADHHEAAVLGAITEAYKKNLGGPRSYVIPVFVDHFSNGTAGTARTIITEYVEGESLSSRLDGLNRRIEDLEREARGTRRKGERKEKRREIRRIEAVKQGFFLLGVTGIAQFVYDLRTSFKFPIEQALEIESRKLTASEGRRTRLEIYDPLQGRQNSKYYETKFNDNLELILAEHLGDPERVERIMGALRKKVDELHPFYPIRECLTRTEGEIILSDCHPGQIKVMPGGVDGVVERHIARGGNSLEDIGRIRNDIINSGRVAIIDLGDLRMGPPLLDFVDFTGHHSFDFRLDAIRGALWEWTRKRASLENHPEQVDERFRASLDELPLIEIYRYMRHAAKSEPLERKYYLSRAMNRLDGTGEVTDLRRFIRNTLRDVNKTIERTRVK